MADKCRVDQIYRWRQQLSGQKYANYEKTAPFFMCKQNGGLFLKVCLRQRVLEDMRREKRSKIFVKPIYSFQKVNNENE